MQLILHRIQSVGVQGDHRSYKNMTVLYNKNDAKDPADTDMEKLYTLAKKIPNELNYINRVTYCLNETAGRQAACLHADAYLS